MAGCLKPPSHANVPMLSEHMSIRENVCKAHKKNKSLVSICSISLDFIIITGLQIIICSFIRAQSVPL